MREPGDVAARARLRTGGDDRRRASADARVDAGGTRAARNHPRRIGRVRTPATAAALHDVPPADAARLRVLMICFAYPPIGGAGMIRSAKFVKFLPEFGYEPVVVTPAHGAARLPCDARSEERR